MYFITNRASYVVYSFHKVQHSILETIQKAWLPTFLKKSVLRILQRPRWETSLTASIHSGLDSTKPLLVITKACLSVALLDVWHQVVCSPVKAITVFGKDIFSSFILVASCVLIYSF